MVGVALTGEVKVGFWESYPLEYAKAGCFGLAGYLAALWVIQRIIERREAHRFATGGVRLVGIGLALMTFAVIPYVPSLIGNLLWATALFSQVIVPFFRAVRTYRAEDRSKEAE